MSLPVENLTCSKCGAECDVRGMGPKPTESYYFPGGYVAPVFKGKQWCTKCQRVVLATKVPSTAEIDEYLASLDLLGNKNYADDLLENERLLLNRLYIKDQSAWKQWAQLEPFKGFRCACGTPTSPLERVKSDAWPEEFVHPNCGGILRWTEAEGGLRISWRYPEELQVRFLDGKGNLYKEGDAARDLLLRLFSALESRSDSKPVGKSNNPRRSAIDLSIHKSPFFVLGVSIRADRKMIVEIAEEKQLELDHEVCQKARSDLTNPRSRLSVEMAWLPGVSPRKASQLIDILLRDPLSIRKESGLPTLAHLNLLAAVFELVDGGHDADDLAAFIMETAYLAEEVSPEDVLRDINEDRAVSGFPEVRTLDQIEAELAERKRYVRGAMKDALDRLPTMTLIQVMTQTVDGATSGGDDHAPGLIDDLVDSYEIETQGILQKEAENVYKIIKVTREHAGSGEAAVKPYVDKLEAIARNWDKIAQPIQLSSKARGIDHELSRDLAYGIRSLAIELFNKHDMLAQSQRLTRLIQELFAEVPEIADKVEEDVDALAGIFQQREQAAARQDEWAREITFDAEIGIVFKDTLSISPQGVSWKGESFPLDSITRVRWGGISHSVNGIPTGTTYTIAFGNRNSEAVVELKNEGTYSTFVDKLWGAVCVRLLTEMLEALKEGRNLHFGDALLHDDGVTLVKRKFLGSNEKVRCTWSEIHVWNANGMFCIGAKHDDKVNAGISYIQVANTHLLEQAIRMGFKKPGMRCLSELLQ